MYDERPFRAKHENRILHWMSMALPPELGKAFDERSADDER